MTDQIGIWLEGDDGKFAAANARGKTFDEFCHRILAICADEFGECCEQARLRKAIAVHAVVPRFRPRLVEIIQCGLFLLLIGQEITGRRPMGRMGHKLTTTCSGRVRKDRACGMAEH